MKYPVTAARTMTRRGFTDLIFRGSIGLALVTAGCGGGGGNTNPSGSAPTAATRSRILSLHDASVRGVTQSGFQSESLAVGRNSFYSGTSVGAGASPSANDSGPRAGSSMPMIGAFLRNIAATAPTSRAAHRHSLKAHSRQENGSTGGDTGVVPPPDGGPFDPMPTFYFDYYLGLWVQTDENTSNSKYLLYEDEAKTKPAGFITTVNPADWEIFPQSYSSSYAFTSGYLAGSHGSSDNVTNADYSGSSRYDNVYADGWKDKGVSRWTAEGDSSWSSRTDGANGEWSEESGSFHADGSGGTRLSSSDGYKSDYQYNADGSGHGRISGSDPGLPATISWDAYGNTTIIYADGSTDHIPGWGSDNGGGDGPIAIDAKAPRPT